MKCYLNYNITYLKTTNLTFLMVLIFKVAVYLDSIVTSLFRL